MGTGTSSVKIRVCGGVCNHISRFSYFFGYSKDFHISTCHITSREMLGCVVDSGTFRYDNMSSLEKRRATQQPRETHAQL